MDGWCTYALITLVFSTTIIIIIIKKKKISSKITGNREYNIHTLPYKIPKKHINRHYIGVYKMVYKFRHKTGFTFFLKKIKMKS